MGIAALVLWILTAGGGFYMFAKWIGGGGHRRQSGSGFPPALIYSHLLLAAAGLVLWIIYLAIDNDPVGWAAVIVLAPVALLGFTMLARWIPLYRGAAADGPAEPTAERSLPPVVVVVHGVLAVTTVVLALLTMLGVGTGEDESSYSAAAVNANLASSIWS
jgi:hypothetical protein